MTGSLKKQDYDKTYADKSYYYEHNHSYCDYIKSQKRVNVKLNKAPKKKKAKKNLLASFFAFVILCAFGYYVCPYNYNHYFRPIFLNKILNRNLKVDIKSYISPTTSYIHNSFLLDKYLLVPGVKKTNIIADLKIVSEMTETKNKLLDLFKKYPALEPSVFVWEYSTNSGLEINADEAISAGDIIKIPLAFELMRLIDESSKTINPIYLNEKRTFSEAFSAKNSLNLERADNNSTFSLNYLAGAMIKNSDNSAANMILNEIGGMDGFNRAMRNLGLSSVSMNNWMRENSDENTVSAAEISKILYNIDNPNYISPKYRNILKEYLGNTRNNHLIQGKLPSDVMVLHKTGQNADMMGDSGIVYANTGKKYIVTILTKRPQGDTSAKQLIQEASLLIYNDIKQLL